jgi:hypothetical protein
MKLICTHPEGWLITYGKGLNDNVVVFRKPLQEVGLEEKF